MRPLEEHGDADFCKICSCLSIYPLAVSSHFLQLAGIGGGGLLTTSSYAQSFLCSTYHSFVLELLSATCIACGWWFIHFLFGSYLFYCYQSRGLTQGVASVFNGVSSEPLLLFCEVHSSILDWLRVWWPLWRSHNWLVCRPHNFSWPFLYYYRLGWRWAFLVQIPVFLISFALTSYNLSYVTPVRSIDPDKSITADPRIG